jgi:hypothetical protein
MGGQSVNPGQYLRQPDYSTQAAILQSKLAADDANYRLKLLQYENQGELLKMASQMAPMMQEFSPTQASQEAAELGLQNLSRSREYERMVDPAAARMREQYAGKLEEATSTDQLENYMNEWARTKGLTGVATSGIDLDSSVARSALFDQATEAGRQFQLANLAAQQGYLSQTPAPLGGLDPGNLMSGKQAAQSANVGTLNNWQQNILQAAQSLGQSLPEYSNTGFGEILSANQAYQQDMQNYRQALYQGAAQDASNKNALTGQLIGAGAGVAGIATAAII